MKRVLPNISVRRRSDQCDRKIATRFVMADVSLWSSRISLGNRAIHAHPRVTPYTKTKSNRGAQSVEGEGTAVHPERCMPWILPLVTAPKILGCSLCHHPFGCPSCLMLRGSCW